MEKIIVKLLSKFPSLERKFDPHMREVLAGSAIAMTLRVVGAGLNLCFNLLLARTFGAGGAGLYFLALTVPMVAATFASLGLNNALLRFISANAAIGNWKKVKGVYSKSVGLALSAALLLTLALFPLSPWISTTLFHKPELAGPLRWGVFSLAPLVFIGLQAEALRGLKRIKDWILVSVLGTSVVSLVGLILVRDKFGVEGPIGVYVFAGVLTAAMGFWLWKRATPQLGQIAGQFNINELLQSSMPLFWISLLETVTYWSSTLFLGVWADKSEVGIFGTASRLAAVVSMILVAVNSISVPKFAALYKKKKMKDLGSLARRTARLMTLLSGPLLLILILFPGFILALFGPEFRAGAPILALLALGQFVNVATGSVAYLLMMSGHEKLLRNRAIFMSVFCLALNILLIPHWGILGAAIATAVCVAMTNLIAAYLVWSKLGIITLPFFPKGRTNG